MAEIELRDVVEDGTPVAKAAFRNAVIRRYAYIIESTENPSDLVANDAGVVPLVLGFNGRWFWIDADDTSSGPPDNVTLIVTADGYRYFSDGLISPVWSVLSQGDNTPPGAPSVGDTYHTGPAPTGDWAGYPNMIAVYTRRGWVFQNIPVGRAIYVVDETSYYHMDENGDFVLGMGTATIGAGTVRDTMLVGSQRFYTVENQNTTTPPGSPGLGVYWIVGSGATGAWAGQDGKIATSYGGGVWTFLTPIEGWHAYDKALNALYKFNGTVWQNAAGAYIKRASVFTAAALPTLSSGASIGTNGYAYSATTAPTTSNTPNQQDTATVTIASDSSGKVLEFDYAFSYEITLTGSPLTEMGIVVGLFRDNEAAAISWAAIPVSWISGVIGTTVRFVVTTNDAASHTYSVRFFTRKGSGSSGIGFSVTASRRSLTVREAA